MNRKHAKINSDPEQAKINRSKSGSKLSDEPAHLTATTPLADLQLTAYRNQMPPHLLPRPLGITPA
jgi:hypothetical protein